MGANEAESAAASSVGGYLRTEEMWIAWNDTVSSVIAEERMGGKRGWDGFLASIRKDGVCAPVALVALSAILALAIAALSIFPWIEALIVGRDIVDVVSGSGSVPWITRLYLIEVILIVIWGPLIVKKSREADSRLWRNGTIAAACRRWEAEMGLPVEMRLEVRDLVAKGISDRKAALASARSILFSLAVSCGLTSAVTLLSSYVQEEGMPTVLLAIALVSFMVLILYLAASMAAQAFFDGRFEKIAPRCPIERMEMLAEALTLLEIAERKEKGAVAPRWRERRARRQIG